MLFQPLDFPCLWHKKVALYKVFRPNDIALHKQGLKCEVIKFFALMVSIMSGFGEVLGSIYPKKKSSSWFKPW